MHRTLGLIAATLLVAICAIHALTPSQYRVPEHLPLRLLPERIIEVRFVGFSDGTLVREATTGEVLRADPGHITPLMLNASDLLIAWFGSICDTGYTITLSTVITLSTESRMIVVTPDPREACDAMAIGYGIVISGEPSLVNQSLRVVLDPDVFLDPEPPVRPVLGPWEPYEP